MRQPRATPSQRGAASSRCRIRLPPEPFEESLLPLDPRSLPECQDLTGAADLVPPPPRRVKTHREIGPSPEQPVEEPRGDPAEVGRQPRAPQVLPGEQEAVA